MTGKPETGLLVFQGDYWLRFDRVGVVGSFNGQNQYEISGLMEKVTINC